MHESPEVPIFLPLLGHLLTESLYSQFRFLLPVRVVISRDFPSSRSFFQAGFSFDIDCGVSVILHLFIIQGFVFLLEEIEIESCALNLFLFSVPIFDNFILCLCWVFGFCGSSSVVTCTTNSSKIYWRF